ncbi:hypothetical protein RDn1_026 [Candidatus Termititenax dinenymphae]|uniref:PKD/Chitinase domain-containing protein n=1 Tax=Candidatus Termititenax dinenymphae TaxID=2218523 RepID=A0A388TJ81_9BACT|nr:hypothetical protein RDn1_026 [Candidatus Termititenax dinenymphae]
MAETNKVLLETNSEYAVELEDGTAAFISSDDTELGDSFGQDSTFIRSKPLPKPNVSGKGKRVKNKQNQQAFMTNVLQKMFPWQRKSSTLSLDNASLSSGFGSKNKPSAEKKTDSGYIYNLKQYDPPEEIAKEKDSYYTVKQTADGAYVDGAYGYSAKTDSYNSVSDYIDPFNPQIANLLNNIPGLNDPALSTEEKLVKLYNYIGENLTYESESADSWSSVGETIAKRGGDCEDLATLLASAMIALLKRSGLDYKTAQGKILAVAGNGSDYGEHVFVEYQAEDGRRYVFDPALHGQPVDSLTELPQTEDLDFTIYFRFNDNKVFGEAVNTTNEVVVFNSAATNILPTANAGSTQNITTADILTLQGSGSDIDGHIASYAWTKISGPGNPSITNANQAVTTVTGLQAGSYLFVFTVTDNVGGRKSATVTVNVTQAAPPANVLPTANAGNDQTIILPGNSVRLNGSGSDSDGTIVSYLWRKLSGPGSPTITSGNSAATDVTNLQEGTYIFALTVTDNKGGTHTDSVTIMVQPPPANILPTANAGNDQTIVLPANSVRLNGSGSDSDGTIVSYLWRKLSGPGSPTITSGNSAATDITNLQEGTYIFALTVTDNKGGTHTDSVTIIVQPPPANILPTANAGNDQTIVLPANSARLNGSGSDSDGTIVSYLWRKLSGPGSPTITSGNSAATDVANLQEGTYIFVLTVTDDKGGVHSDSVTIVVEQPQNILPTASTGGDIYLTLPVNSAELNGGYSSDEDGTIVSYKWRKISGPDIYTLTNADNDIANVSDLVEGSYIFVLTVTDDKGGIHSDYVTITVSSTPPKDELNPERMDGTHDPLDHLGTIIDQDVTDAIIAMSYDENFLEPFYSYSIREGIRANMFLDADHQTELERLLTEGNKEKLDDYIAKEVLPWLAKEYDLYDKGANKNNYNQYANNCRRILSTIDELKRWIKTTNISTIKSQVCKKTKTPFLIVNTEKFNQMRDGILLKSRIQKLLTMLTQAKGDSYNAIQEIILQQTVYQKMNIEKLNDKQIDSLTNYVNARAKEINEYARNYNEKAEAELRKAQQEQREYENTNLFLRLIVGVAAIIVSVIAAIFSAGATTALVLSTVTTVMDIVQTIRKTDKDVEIKKEQEKLEEQLTLLRTSEKKMEEDYLRSKKEELERLKTQALAAGNKEYAQMLDIEIQSLGAVIDSTALNQNDGFLKFNNEQYTKDSLRVNMLAMLMRIVASIQKAEHEGRNIVASELSLPSTTVSSYGGEIINNAVLSLIETFNKKGTLEMQTMQSYNKGKLLREEIKQAKTSLTSYVLGRVFFSLIDIATFGTGGSVAQSVLRGTGESVYNLIGKQQKAANAKYDPNKAAVFDTQDYNELYANILSNSSHLMRDLTENKKALDYNRYLQVMQDIGRLQRLENIEIILDAADKNSRNIIHQELTDKKTRTQDTTAKIASQQNISLLRDVVDKQKQLTQIQIQSINQKVDQRTELLNAGYNILVSVFAGWLGGQSSIAANNNDSDDALSYGLIKSILEQNKDNIFDLAIGDSDLKLRPEDQGTSQGGTQAGLTGFGSDDLWQQDKHGNVTVDQTVLLKKYAKLQRQLMLDQALASLQSAGQKSREVVHMELAGKSAATTGLTKELTAINKEDTLTQWNILVDKAYARAEQLSKKNVRTTDLQRDLLTSFVSASVTALAYAGGMNNDQSEALGTLTALSMKTLYTLQNIYDTTLDAVNRLTAEDLEGVLAEELGLIRLSEKEKELLLEALDFKNISGEYGSSVEDRGRLEYLQVLLEGQQKTQDILLKIKDEIDSGHYNVHSVLDTAAVKVESMLKDYQDLHKQFIQQLMQSLKKGASEISQRENDRNRQLINLQLEAFDATVQALQIMTPFLNDQTDQQTLRNFTQGLQALVPLLKAGHLYFARGEQERAETVDLSTLAPEDRLRVEAAYAGADLSLSETSHQSGLFDQMMRLTEQAIKSISKITAQAITDGIMKSRLEQLLNTTRQEEAERELKKQITSLFNNYTADHPLYSFIQKAQELYSAGDYAGAAAALNNIDVVDLKTALESLAKQKADQNKDAEKLNTFKASLDYVRKNSKAFNDLLKKVQAQEITVEAFKETKIYQDMQTAVLTLAPLFDDQARYDKIIEELIPAASFYGGETEILLNTLLSAQNMYVQYFIQSGSGLKSDALENLQRYQLAVNKYQPYNPDTDSPESIWAKFFTQRAEQKKVRENIAAQNKEVIDQAQQAQKDVDVLRGLFDEHPGEEIDISAIQGISQDLKLYLIEICADTIIPAAKREQILAFVERRRNNRQITALDSTADLEYAQTLLDNDWQEIQTAHDNYNRLVEYCLTIGNEIPPAISQELKKQEDDIAAKEKAFAEKRERFLRMQTKGVFN